LLFPNAAAPAKTKKEQMMARAIDMAPAKVIRTYDRFTVAISYSSYNGSCKVS